ncbi:MAG TPA: GNAT family N-acetyltransferase [Steroidobacteraceae bacterium]|nr:GNAT family N-acetyltransferase [Steroidobacteraceae bacterium]
MTTTNYIIRPGNPLDTEVRALIDELDAFNTALYPAESNHFDAPETLAAALSGSQGVFLVVEQDGELVGCGAAKHCGQWAELKRMYLKPKARGGGIALAMLVKLLDWARGQGLPVARLETGNVSVGALKLYRRAGFKEIPAFPPYRPDPLSIFMERALR